MPPGEPGPGEIRVRIHASSLNFHDYGVACRREPVDDGRIPMSDGAGVVQAVGDGVDEFNAGDSSSLRSSELAGGAGADQATSDNTRRRRRRLRAGAGGGPATWLTDAPKG